MSGRNDLGTTRATCAARVHGLKLITLITLITWLDDGGDVGPWCGGLCRSGYK